MNQQALVLEDIIDESIPMQPMHPMVFDDYMAEGWRLLGTAMVRHNYSICRGKFCRTIPLRVRLQEFSPSKSQRKLLRRNQYLMHEIRPISITPEHERIFTLHSERFSERRPNQIWSFLGANAHREPVHGKQIDIYTPSRELIASSFLHVGHEAVSGTYCFFDPDYSALSLGAYTMLLELVRMKEAGYLFYYHGYTYDVPSQFDYKLNFDHLDSMDWHSGVWHQQPRMAVRRWIDLVELPDKA